MTPFHVLVDGIDAIDAIDLIEAHKMRLQNRYYGRDGIRIGAYRGSIGRPQDTPGPDWVNHGKGHYVRNLVDNFPSRVRSADEAEDSLDVYRSVLSEAADHSVVLVSLGHVTNLVELLRSRPDEWSRLSGLELVKRKVRQMVMSESISLRPRNSCVLEAAPM